MAGIIAMTFVMSILSIPSAVSAVSCTGVSEKTGTCETDTCSGTFEQEKSPEKCQTFEQCCVPKDAGGGKCTGSGGKSGTCTTMESCSGTTEYNGSCKGTTPFCCIPKDAGGGMCPASDCQSAAVCNDGKHKNDTRTCSETTKQCCPVKDDGGTPSEPSSFPNPLKYDTVEAVLGAILSALQGIIVLLALVFIVFGAVVYVTSAGNDKRIELAKEAIFAAMIGLALGIAAPSFLKEIAKILGWGSDKVPSEVTAAKTIAQILFNTLDFLLGILGVLALIMLIIGAFMYVTSAGSDDMIERGKKIVIWSSVGVVVAFSSLVLINQIAGFF